MSIDTGRQPSACSSIAEPSVPTKAASKQVYQGSNSKLGTDVPVGGAMKRALDLVVALVSLLLLLPVFLFVMIAIRVTMGAPVFFTHTRVTTNGCSFPCIKFRTMINDNGQIFRKFIEDNPEAAREWQETQKLRNDPRISKFGHFLRKTSIDELPQLVNVLRNEMSCVGPRPITEEELQRYGINAADYLRTKPGMTGMWQISGRNSLPYSERIRLDTEYARSWSMTKDLMILLKTIIVVFRYDRTC